MSKRVSPVAIALLIKCSFKLSPILDEVKDFDLTLTVFSDKCGSKTKSCKRWIVSGDENIIDCVHVMTFCFRWRAGVNVTL